MTQSQSFKQLHSGNKPLILGNVWDAHSAKVVAEAGLKAMGTSSAAVANCLGFDDGQEMSFHELLKVVENIQRVIEIPLTVDIEGGYSNDPGQVAEYISMLADLGVVGINVEDSLVAGDRYLRPAEEFAIFLDDVVARIPEDIFVNVRTDPFLLNEPDALEKVLSRAVRFEDSGADGIFVPCLAKPEDIHEVVKNTKLPINVMAVPGLPHYMELARLGVKRVSMGDAMLRLLGNHHLQIARGFLKDESFAGLFQ